jgi:hypothetical protein
MVNKKVDLKKFVKKGLEISGIEKKLLKGTKRLKHGAWGSQSLDNLKRRTLTKKKIRAKVTKYKRKGYTPKSRLK